MITVKKQKTRFHHPIRERGFTGYRIANITFKLHLQQRY